ncbi:MAG: PQQ-dependent sugar dehydrogenase [Candidatus Taylorbacteria bacterium]|nr:PQQ-dependent sugar dehydrogenase [Candidatus Taylorbacteria bacterium]
MEYKTNHRSKIILGIIIIILLLIFAFILIDGSSSPKNPVTITTTPSPATSTTPIDHHPIAPPTVIATGLKIPWDIAFLPDESLLVTERAGNLVHIEKNGNKTSIKLPHSVQKGEGGLLGIALHPDFKNNQFLYLYMTIENSVSSTKNTVFRYRYENGILSDEKIIISNIPGALYHDGGRLGFGPDGFLYITTGDAQTPAIAQDLKSLGGKILRLKDDGNIPSDNPFGTAVYSYGHRNPQGLAWDNEGRLWSTEHGRSGETSGMDEINIIEKGKNYGWPTIEGDSTANAMETPILNSGAKVTWAPASALYLKGSLFFGGLLGESLYEAVLDNGQVKELRSHFHNTYSRIRTVRLGLDGMLYITTSNRDGRGKPVENDDRIIKIDPRSLK